MAYAHRNGFVHADFKPANAFLLPTGAVKIIDFGIARAAKRGVEAPTARSRCSIPGRSVR